MLASEEGSLDVSVKPETGHSSVLHAWAQGTRRGGSSGVVVGKGGRAAPRELAYSATLGAGRNGWRVQS